MKSVFKKAISVHGNFHHTFCLIKSDNINLCSLTKKRLKRAEHEVNFDWGNFVGHVTEQIYQMNNPLPSPQIENFNPNRKLFQSQFQAQLNLPQHKHQTLNEKHQNEIYSISMENILKSLRIY